jgi:hypothetical protein
VPTERQLTKWWSAEGEAGSLKDLPPGVIQTEVGDAEAMAALVLSIPGAFLALFLTRSAISMPSMIGLIMLMGIATKNSILLVYRNGGGRLGPGRGRSQN